MKLLPFLAILVVGGAAGFVLGVEVARRSAESRMHSILEKLRHQLTDESELVAGVISVELTAALRHVNEAAERVDGSLPLTAGRSGKELR